MRCQKLVTPVFLRRIRRPKSIARHQHRLTPGHPTSSLLARVEGPSMRKTGWELPIVRNISDDVKFVSADSAYLGTTAKHQGLPGKRKRTLLPARRVRALPPATYTKRPLRVYGIGGLVLKRCTWLLLAEQTRTILPATSTASSPAFWTTSLPADSTGSLLPNLPRGFCQQLA